MNWRQYKQKHQIVPDLKKSLEKHNFWHDSIGKASVPEDFHHLLLIKFSIFS